MEGSGGEVGKRAGQKVADRVAAWAAVAATEYAGDGDAVGN